MIVFQLGTVLIGSLVVVSVGGSGVEGGEVDISGVTSLKFDGGAEGGEGGESGE